MSSQATKDLKNKGVKVYSYQVKDKANTNLCKVDKRLVKGCNCRYKNKDDKIEDTTPVFRKSVKGTSKWRQIISRIFCPNLFPGFLLFCRCFCIRGKGMSLLQTWKRFKAGRHPCDLLDDFVALVGCDRIQRCVCVSIEECRHFISVFVNMIKVPIQLNYSEALRMRST